MRSKHPFAALTFILLTSISLIPATAGVPLDPRPILETTNVTVSGRVKTPEGKPIKGANVVLKDADTNEVVRSAFSNSFGYYKLDQIATGHSYVLIVTHRRYLFALPSQVLEINEERPGTDFTGEADN